MARVTSEKKDPWEEYYDLPRDDFSEADIWRAAHHLLKLLPEDAWMTASRRADIALDMGDLFNFNFWVRITTAIREIERHQPGKDEQIN
jgi:hypothetical protein